MATNPGGPLEHEEGWPSAARPPRCRATDRQRDHYDSLTGRRPTTLSARTATVLLLTLLAILLLIACSSDGTGPVQTPDPDEPRSGAEATRQQEPRRDAASATPAPTRPEPTPQDSRPSLTVPPAATSSPGPTSPVTGPTSGPIPGTATPVRPTLIPPSQASQETDRAVLRAILDRFPEVERGIGWFQGDRPIRQFSGVEVEGGRVVGLNLSWIDGQIPPEIGSLDRLEVLNLSGSEVTGELPPELSELPNLRVLRIVGEPYVSSGLTGGILPGLAHVVSLEELDLRNNELTGSIPSELGDLVNLRELILQGNRLTGEIPQELADLPELKTLLLVHPSTSSLEATNRFTGCLARGFLDRSSLVLRLGNLPFCPLPAGSMSPRTDREALLALYESMDRPRGDEWDSWNSDAPLNRWTGVTTDAEGRVTELRLGEMGIDGVLPPAVGDLNKLRILILGNRFDTPSRSLNSWRERIPPELGYLTELEELNLASSGWGGGIPRELGKLLKLERLLLAGNALRGEIPPELGNLSRLELLALIDNRLTGEVPSEQGQLTNLTLLYLGGRDLTGSVPDSLRNQLDLQRSHMGALPFCQEQAAADRDAEALARRTREALVALYDDAGGPGWTENDNWSSDSPVAEWFGVTVDGDGRVTGLRLFWNNLRGQLPPELGDLTSLRELYLYGDELSGPVPAELGSLIGLRELYINQNNLTGCIPSALREQLDLDNSDLGGLRFC